MVAIVHKLMAVQVQWSIGTDHGTKAIKCLNGRLLATFFKNIAMILLLTIEFTLTIIYTVCIALAMYAQCYTQSYIRSVGYHGLPNESPLLHTNSRWVIAWERNIFSYGFNAVRFERKTKITASQFSRHGTSFLISSTNAEVISSCIFRYTVHFWFGINYLLFHWHFLIRNFLHCNSACALQFSVLTLISNALTST